MSCLCILLKKKKSISSFRFVHGLKKMSLYSQGTRKLLHIHWLFGLPSQAKIEKRNVQHWLVSFTPRVMRKKKEGRTVTILKYAYGSQ